MSQHGFISPVDCFVHVTVSTDDQAAWLSALAHEMTHYVQLLATPVGIQIATRQRWLAIDMAVFLHNQPQPVQFGVLGPRLADDRGSAADPSAVHLAKRLADCRIFSEPFFAPDGARIFDECFPAVTASHEEAHASLRERRPIVVDPAGGAFVLRESGCRVPVAANTIMEYAARMIQLQSEARIASEARPQSGAQTESPGALIGTVRDPQRIHYHLPLIYLIQEGILEEVEIWASFLGLLMVAAQTALLIDPLALDERTRRRYSLGAEFLPQVFFLRAIQDPLGVNDRYAAALAGATPSPRGLADWLLQRLHWPSVDELLGAFRADIDDNIDLATNLNRAASTVDRVTASGRRTPAGLIAPAPDRRLPLAQYRKRQLETYRALCFQMWDDGATITNPLNMMSSTPAPLLADLDAQGLKLNCNDPNQTFWDCEAEGGNALLLHVCQKILFGEDLTCYNDPLARDTRFACPHVIACCMATERHGFDCCSHDGWKSYVASVLRIFEIRVA